MSATQISFSAFAASKTALEDLAVSDQAGQRGCFFPQPKFVGGVTPLVTGGCTSSPISELRDEFWYDRSYCLDAPGFVASGGLVGLTSFGVTRPCGVASRS